MSTSIHILFESKFHNCGLFRINYGTLTQITIESGVSSPSDYWSRAGSICTINYGTISNCTNGATIGSGNTLGGICGVNGGTITGCINTGTIKNCHIGGGIAGSTGTISNCTNSGTIDAGDNHNPICGKNNGGKIINCTPDGENTEP